MKLALFALCIATAPVAACANDREDVLSIGNDACGHFADGPVATATATTTPEEAVDVSQQHTRYDLTLIANNGQRGGFVKVTIATGGDYTFLFDATTSVVLSDAAGTAIAPGGSAGVDADCATIGTELVYALTPGTYTLGLSTASADPLLMVWMHAAMND